MAIKGSNFWLINCTHVLISVLITHVFFIVCVRLSLISLIHVVFLFVSQLYVNKRWKKKDPFGDNAYWINLEYTYSTCVIPNHANALYYWYITLPCVKYNKRRYCVYCFSNKLLSLSVHDSISFSFLRCCLSYRRVFAK